jgi:hypothetical protein
MYSLINRHIDLVLSNVNRDLDIDTYLYLMGTFAKINVAQDEVFQLKYRTYWGLNAARLSHDFCLAYFDLMECLRGNNNFDIEVVSRQLYETPTHKNGRQSLQFSFASKLVHTLEPKKPIYDSRVADFFFFPPLDPTKELDIKLQALLPFYRFLCLEYERVLTKGLLEPSITKFRSTYELDRTYTDEKIIDTLIWRFVTLLRSTALRDGSIRYS